ncbi:hypothetical protein C8R46DRAFT_1350427 [Mycena filopes]|nr:hypothetical protein C8R46DRAFT_1350427 [Mycena filopes]
MVAFDSPKTCDRCRATNKKNQKDSRARSAARAASANPTATKKRKRASASLGTADDPPATRRRVEDPTSPPEAPDAPEDSDDEMGGAGEEDKASIDFVGMSADIESFLDAEGFYDALRAQFKEGSVDFHGAYPMAPDPLVSPRERVQMVTAEIWAISNYRFTVRDHKKLKNGHRTRLWCSQDEARKKKSKASDNPDIRNRDTVGMKRYRCGSFLSVRCEGGDGDDTTPTITVKVKHCGKHVNYLDVSMPPAALAMIRDNVQWLTPVAMVNKVQAAFPIVTAAQIHRAWMEMSEPFWRFDDDQLLSTKKLLEEHTDDVDIFEPQDVPEGVEMVCWGMKNIAAPLKGKVVEIGVDATFNTNSKHLELYSIMTEHDGAGFPLSYLLLSTASSIDQGKRTKALTAWAKCVRDTYGVDAKFAHVDKDMAEIKMLKNVWHAKISLLRSLRRRRMMLESCDFSEWTAAALPVHKLGLVERNTMLGMPGAEGNPLHIVSQSSLRALSLKGLGVSISLLSGFATTGPQPFDNLDS